MMLRGLIIGQLGKYGDPATIAMAKEKFEEHITGKNLLDANLEVAVFSIALASGDESTFQQLVKVRWTGVLAELGSWCDGFK